MLDNKFGFKQRVASLRWLSAAIMLSVSAVPAWAFSIDDVAQQAEKLSQKGFEAPKSNLPAQFRDMKFADYQQIRFNNDKSYWNNVQTPFKLQFYHQGCISIPR